MLLLLRTINQKSKVDCGDHSGKDLIKLTRKIEDLNIEWDDKKEILFLADKKRAAHNFHQSSGSQTYFDCGFARYTQKVLNDTDVKRLRNKLLAEVADGNTLATNELKYLELTSETLNSFLDKPALQGGALMLDPDFLDKVG